VGPLQVPLFPSSLSFGNNSWISRKKRFRTPNRAFSPFFSQIDGNPLSFFFLHELISSSSRALLSLLPFPQPKGSSKVPASLFVNQNGYFKTTVAVFPPPRIFPQPSIFGNFMSVFSLFFNYASFFFFFFFPTRVRVLCLQYPPLPAVLVEYNGSSHFFSGQRTPPNHMFSGLAFPLNVQLFFSFFFLTGRQTKRLFFFPFSPFALVGVRTR